MRHALAVVASGLLLPALASATAEAGDASRPRVDTLAWLSGTWTGTENDLSMEEHWTEPAGGILLGLHRDVKDGRTVLFEFLRIEETPDAVTYWASPKGRPATPFKLVEHAEKRVVFENKDHDFPQRILYWIDVDGSLAARVEGTRGGKSSSEEWRWKKKTR
jgi:hypothetical protein